MPLLEDSFYDNLRNTPSAPPPSQPTVMPGSQPIAPTASPSRTPIADATLQRLGYVPGNTPGVNPDPDAAVKLFGDITPESQISRFGGLVGSPEYYAKKAEGNFLQYLPGQLAETVGIRLPDDETWDKMSLVDKGLTAANASKNMLGRMIADLPKEIVKAPIRVGLTLAEGIGNGPWERLYKNEEQAKIELGKGTPTELPWLGQVPTLFQTFEQAQASGMGPLASYALLVGTTAGDLSLVGSLGEAVTAGLRPRGKIPTATQTTAGTPESFLKSLSNRESAGSGGYSAIGIPTAHGRALGKYQVMEEYLPGWSKQYIGREVSADEFIANPALQEQLVKARVSELYAKHGNYEDVASIWHSGRTLAQARAAGAKDGLGTKTEDYVRDIMGGMGASTAVKTSTPMQVAPIKSAIIRDAAGIGKAVAKRPGSIAEYYSLPKTVVKENYGTAPNTTFLKVTPAGSQSVEISVVQLRGGAIQKGIDYIKDHIGNPTKRYEGDFGPEVKMDSKIVNIKPGESTSVAKKAEQMTPEDEIRIFRSIPAKPLKGFENKPITGDQIVTLEEVGNFNGIEPTIRDAVVRAVTGKQVVGELTQAEFVKAAQTLQTFSSAGKFTPDMPNPSIMAKAIAPQRHWMRSYEESSGIPLYSQVYVPMEEATRVRNVFRDSYRNEAREVFGKYAEPAFAEERRLVSAYMRGEKNAITNNPTLSAQAKTELIAVADGMRALYDKIGPQVDVPTDIFLKDYQPGVRDLGGVFNLYKSTSNEFPTMKEFFAKQKKTGDLGGVQIDDALALFDIYANAGSNWMFMKPTLDRVKEVSGQLPQTVRGAAKNYVEEKMGYGGQLEEFLDNMVPGVNKKLGLNLPPDTARQMSNYVLSTMYSGMLSSPATWFRQTFQYPLFGYARLGPRYMGEGMKKGLSKEGMDEVRKQGFLVDLGVPYGEELLKETRAAGRFANAYKNTTQTIIAPNSIADASMRSIVYHQGKLQFDDALARYNAGDITWEKLEKDMDFSAMSPVDRNIIRQKLVAGDQKGAFNHYIREVIDETNFPYRRGASSQAGYGLTGKLTTSLLQWPIEAGHVLGRWASTGQWDKLIRFYAASTAISRTMSETFGFDFQRNLSPGGMFGNFWSPYVKTGIDAVNAFTSFFQDNKEDFNKNSESIVRTLRAGGIPGGIAIQNATKFFRSYDRGPNEQGQYAVMNNDGEVSYYTDFADLFWGQLMGFPTNEKEAASRLTKEIKNAQFDRRKVKEHVMQLMQQEKYEEAGKLMGEYGISVTPKDMDDYYIPYNERAFQSLPGPLKAQFVNQVYPTNNQ